MARLLTAAMLTVAMAAPAAPGEEPYEELQPLLDDNHGIYAITVSPDGSRLFTAANGGIVKLWDLRAGRGIARYKKTIFESAKFLPDGKHVLCGLSGDGGHRLVLLDARTGKEVRRFIGKTTRDYVMVKGLGISPDGKQAVSAGALDKTMRLWDLKTGKELHRFELPAPVWDADFSPDGRYAACCMGRYESDGDLEMAAAVWDLYRLPSWLRPRPGRHVDTTIRLFDLKTGKEIRRFEGHRSIVWSISFSPDGGRLLSSGGANSGKPYLTDFDRDNSVRLWDVQTGRELHCMEGHTSEVDTSAISPDGRRALSASGGDRTVRLWDLETGEEEHRFQLNPYQAIVDVAFSADGERALCVEYCDVRQWRLPKLE